MPSESQVSKGFIPLEDGSHHEATEDAQAAPKRIVICCDGTWQSSVSGLKNIPSNVTRLARSIARSGKDKDGKVWQQVVYYDAGIGSGDLGQAEANRQGGTGIGFVGNVIEAYNFIVLNYNLGDEIFCFGFSRGAYTARAVAGLVTDIGIVCPRDLQDFPDLYALYQKNPDGLHFRKSQAYLEWVNGVPSKKQANGGSQIPSAWDSPPHHDAPEPSRFVKVVGVFDTVGSLGIPDLPWTRFNLKFLEKTIGITEPGFHNIHLSPCKLLVESELGPSKLTFTQTSSMPTTPWLWMNIEAPSHLVFGTSRPTKIRPRSLTRMSRSFGQTGRRYIRLPMPARKSCKKLGALLSTARCMSSCATTGLSFCRSGSQVFTSTLVVEMTILLQIRRAISNVSPQANGDF